MLCVLSGDVLLEPGEKAITVLGVHGETDLRWNEALVLVVNDSRTDRLGLDGEGNVPIDPPRPLSEAVDSVLDPPTGRGFPVGVVQTDRSPQTLTAVSSTVPCRSSRSSTCSCCCFGPGGGTSERTYASIRTQSADAIRSYLFATSSSMPDVCVVILFDSVISTCGRQRSPHINIRGRSARMCSATESMH